MKINTKTILSFSLLLGLLVVPMLAGAQWQAERGSSQSNLSTISFYTLLITIMKYLLGILTILAIIGFVISGIYYIVAGGAGQQETAKAWMINCIIGIVVGLIGYIVIILIDALMRGNTPLS